MNADIKYFVYVSDTKVDMFYSQIPPSILEKIAAELTIDLKVVSIAIKEKESQKTRYSKLNLVLNYLEKHWDIGTVDSPAAYFKDTLPMRWGPYRDSSDGVVYFGGATNRTILGLGGSLKHVIGNPGDSSAHSYSATPVLLAFLYRELQMQERLREWGRVPASEEGAIVEDMKQDPKVLDQDALLAVYLATAQMQGPTQHLEFVARKLLHGCPKDRNLEGKSVLLGTPIYVALAD